MKAEGFSVWTESDADAPRVLACEDRTKRRTRTSCSSPARRLSAYSPPSLSRVRRIDEASHVAKHQLPDPRWGREVRIVPVQERRRQSATRRICAGFLAQAAVV